MNRGKRSICLDVTRPEGRPVFEAPVRQAEVAVVPMKPAGVPCRALGYEEFAAGWRTSAGCQAAR